MEQPDVQCTNCALDLRPESAVMRNGKPFCDDFCYEIYVGKRGKVELQYEKRDSVEVTRNAKGEYGWKIKLYYQSSDEAIDPLVGDLKETDTQLREVFL